MVERRDHPTLDEVLADPIIRAVMEADRVDPRALADDLRRVAEEIDWAFVLPAPSLQACELCS